MIRAFAAIELNADIRAALASARDDLVKLGAQVKWVDVRNIHLTLAFLGDVPDAVADAAGLELARIGDETAPFDCMVSGLGFFGSPRFPRVVWAGAESSPAVLSLQGAVAAAMEALGIAPDRRPYSPHLTLGRVKSARNAEALVRGIRAAADLEFGRIEARSVSLIKSELRPEGPAYTVLRRAPLRGS